MRKLNIAFDLDGTCVDLQSQFGKYIKDWVNIDVSQCKQFDFSEELNIDSDFLWSAIHMAYLDWKETPILPGVKDLMKILSFRSNSPIDFITRRPKKFATETFQLIERFCPYPFRVAMCGNSSDKILYLKGFKYFVDDRRKTALELAQCDIKIFMPSMSYNLLPKGYPTNITPLKSKGLQGLVHLSEMFLEENDGH